MPVNSATIQWICQKTSRSYSTSIELPAKHQQQQTTKTTNNMKTKSNHPSVKQGLVALFLAFAFSASAANQNPGILPINSSPYGQSYGAWAALWWQWAM